MGSQTAVFTHTYDEAFNLIVEARNYLTMIEARERLERDVETNLKMSCEALRVTSRLTQAMAWLMMQRAVQEGEVSLEESLCEGNRLSGQDVCLDCKDAEDETLPKGLRSLLDRSLSLYERVGRLEKMVLSRAVMH